MRIIAAYRSPPRASIFTHETHGQGEPAMSGRGFHYKDRDGHVIELMTMPQ